MRSHYSTPQMEITSLNSSEDILSTSNLPNTLEDILESEIDIVDRVSW